MQKNIINHIIAKYGSMLGENDRSFIKRVYSTPSEIYSQRLKAIGFLGKGKVLDAGCGFGQWSIELAKLNDFIYAVDIKSERISILNEISAKIQVNNIKTSLCRLEKLPYNDKQFDAIFCYGVIFCTAWKDSLCELVRVLKNEGFLYVTANGLGWHINLWKNCPNATVDYDPRKNVIQSLWNTIKYEKSEVSPKSGQIIIEVEQMVDVMEQYGLKVIEKGGEGTIHFNSDDLPPKPFFQATYFEETGVYEILAIKTKN